MNVNLNLVVGTAFGLEGLIVVLLVIACSVNALLSEEEVKHSKKKKGGPVSVADAYDAAVEEWKTPSEDANLQMVAQKLLNTVEPLHHHYTAPLPPEDQHSLDSLMEQAGSLYTLYKNTSDILRARNDVSAAVNEELAELGKAVANFQNQRANTLAKELDRDTEFLQNKFHANSALSGGSR